MWWYYSIEQYKRSGKSSSWVKLESDTSKQSFNIDDTSGLCLVMPEGADLTARYNKKWQGRLRHPLGGAGKNSTSTLGRLLNSNFGFGKHYRHTERLIKEHDPLYVLGHFSTDSSSKRSLSIEKMTGNILRLWKQELSSLLEKYDSNGDGELDVLSGLYRWKAIGWSLAFLLAGCGATWYISARFSTGL